MMIAGTDLAQKAVAPVGPELPSLVLFGRSATGRPRAAWFSGADADAAIVSAEAARLRTQSLCDEAQREIAGQFARGRILPSGKAFVPFAQRALYGRFVALVGDNFGFTAADPAPGKRKNAASEPKAKAGLAETKDVKKSPTTAGVREAGAALAGSNGDGNGDTNNLKPDPADEPAKPRPGDPSFIGEPLPRSPEQIGLGSIVLAHEGADEGWWEAEVIAFNGRVFSLRWRDYPTEPTILRKAGELALLPSGEA